MKVILYTVGNLNGLDLCYTLLKILLILIDFNIQVVN